MTMNGSWGYKSYDHNWKTPETLILSLAEVVSKGGNFLLNVGPESNGEFPQESVQILKTINEWMKINNEAIYGCGYVDLEKQDWGYFTKNRVTGKIYMIVVNFPVNNTLRIKLPVGKMINNSCPLLDRNQNLIVEEIQSNEYNIHLGQKLKDTHSIVVIEISLSQKKGNTQVEGPKI